MLTQVLYSAKTPYQNIAQDKQLLLTQVLYSAKTINLKLPIVFKLLLTQVLYSAKTNKLIRLELRHYCLHKYCTVLKRVILVSW
ncbi:Uncharacterised protein, partial [Mycoplasmoides gallisepticum]